MIFKDYYRILGLESSKVTSEKIKSAYREQAKKYHPDVNVGSKVAEERFKDINEAYRVLQNSSSKRKYDRIWNSNVGNKRKNQEVKQTTGSMFNDFFYMFFGNTKENKGEFSKESTKKNYAKGENVETEINISIKDAFYGTTKKIALKDVDGTTKNYIVKVPAGIKNNEKIRLIGQGKPSNIEGKNGDLLIRIKIKDDSKFKLKGNDIYTDLLLTPWEAALRYKNKNRRNR